MCTRAAIWANGLRWAQLASSRASAVAGARLVECLTRDEIAEDAEAVLLLDGQVVLGAQSQRGVRADASRSAAGFVEGIDLALGAGQIADERPRQHPGDRVVDQHAEQAAGTHRADDPRECTGHVVDRVEHAVRQDEVELLAGEHVGDGLDVALDGPHALGDAGLAGPTPQRCQRVDAHVEDRDRCPGCRERHREPAGATTAVEHRRTRCARTQRRDQQLVDLQRRCV